MEYAVLMSVYEKENPLWLKESIESILCQTVLPQQVVIVKDGKLPIGLNEIIDSYKDYTMPFFTIVQLPENRGLGKALNEGIKKVKYDYIARMDSDDISMPGRCEKQLNAINEKEADIVSGTLLEFDSSIEYACTLKELPSTHEDIIKYARRRNPFNHPCVMYKKVLIESVDMYRDVKLFEDYDLWIRALRAGAVGYNIKEPILYMRAGRGMYDRRGGAEYVRRGIAFRWKIYKSGFSSFLDFTISSIGQIISGILPTNLRKRFYKKILRK